MQLQYMHSQPSVAETSQLYGLSTHTVSPALRLVPCPLTQTDSPLACAAARPGPHRGADHPIKDIMCIETLTQARTYVVC